MSNNRKRKPTIKQRFSIYKKRFMNLDKQTRMQILAIVGVIALIVIIAVVALFSTNNNNINDVDSNQEQLDNEYSQDEYILKMEEFDEVILKTNNETDSAYFRETLFIGDSNTEGIAAYGHLALQQVIGVTSMGIQSVVDSKCVWFVGNDNPVTIPQAVSMLKPRRIIINYGTNNAYGMETDTFIEEYKAAIKAIEKAYPYADIIVASILPVGKVRSYKQITMQTIDEFNLALVEMCKEEGYKFLNTSEIFRDSSTGFMKEDYVSPDGVHLNNDGFKALLEYVGTHKYITQDTRPALGTIPTRRNPPYEDTTSSETIEPSIVPSISPSPSPSLSPSPSPSPSISPSPSPEASPSPSPETSPSPSIPPSPSPDVSEEPTPTPVEPSPEVSTEPSTEVSPTPSPDITQTPSATPENTQPPESQTT